MASHGEHLRADRPRAGADRLGPRAARRRRGRGRRRAAACRRRSSARRRSPSATPASSTSSTARALREAMARARGDLRAGRPRRLLRRAALLDRHGRPGERRAAAEGAGAARRRSQTTLLFFELEWAALSDERAEELLAGEGLDFCRHHLRNVRRYREHLLTEPEEKILAEKALTGAGAWTRLFEELTSAIEVELPGDERAARDGRARRRPQPAAAPPDREVRRGTAEAVTRGARAGAAHARVPVQHAARRQGDRRPPAPLPALAGGAQPRQRGQRRVGAGADRGGPRAL